MKVSLGSSLASEGFFLFVDLWEAQPCLVLFPEYVMVHGCMVYTELAPRRQQFHVAPAMPVL